jgi:molybdopterin converting factor subunit 1
MRVRVLYFGVLREMVGRSDEAMELGDGATVEELLRILRGRESNESMANDRTWQGLAIAVNREYVAVETVLRGGDEVALLPPVSGGACGESGAGDDR